ncbi:MAG TPA: GxxExxY protein [Vicinamibacterales bacterium]|jgi:GxxExxY protein|nr:GxxExxY protein [Vicinamibacterales bacterium]
MHHDLLHREVTEQIIGGFYEVHYELGGGFLEHVYRSPIIEVLRGRGLLVEDNARLPVHFRGRLIAEFRPDLVINQVVLVELKAHRAIEPADEAQIISYLRASNVEVGLLLNFGPNPSFKRHVYANSRKIGSGIPWYVDRLVTHLLTALSEARSRMIPRIPRPPRLVQE